MTEAEAAAHFGLRPQTLSNWRTTKRYPLPYVRVGRRIRYDPRDLAAWIDRMKGGLTHE